jgi:deoxyadenosine/deoxycytidine kinase
VKIGQRSLYCQWTTMLITIDGCPGAGKTTVAKGLALYRSSPVLLEEFEANPFLRAFYQHPVDNATETEFAFLLLHFHQLKRHFPSIQEAEVIADFHLGKDLIYADLNLPDARVKDAFRCLFEICSEKAPSPALLVFLSVPNDIVVARIHRRNRDFEQVIDPEYYSVLNAAYESYFKRFSGKKLRIPMAEWDFIEHPELYKRLAERIDQELATS